MIYNIVTKSVNTNERRAEPSYVTYTLQKWMPSKPTVDRWVTDAKVKHPFNGFLGNLE